MKKWLVLIFAAILFIVSGYKIYILNIRDAEFHIEETTTHYGVASLGIAPTVISKPKVKKMMINKNQNKVLRVTVPYKISLMKGAIGNKSLKQTIDMSNQIRIQAGGTVWTANPSKNIVLTGKNWKTSGNVTIDLYIQDGYPETALRNFQVYLLESTGTTLTIVHKYV
ncbi:hypothetical protein [Lactiplantibacillus mudanjiangensis]|uniref:Uncharacterized protein n=1 Tax=Lactiplantibacillus mudanjiangensis TaxID=1296538 RepID=A0A660E1L6_9LACO|nr:hypothetical protein [Lactiplantibacillus mudanjiangensis]VDG18037.1 hypothetical protein MUDAN_BIHEEGNE_00563 [Lactiplantibacillus mudanjiangensis]VDG24796.1 hypothetical protein MUDAN_IGPPGNFN_00826 [Lactiplantibacillus mudanjiangensis]VDG28457.1 hypothetical protein MUDAN_MDHGFNIF_00643 [Lactiplantibacillus mudanjiangensis]